MNYMRQMKDDTLVITGEDGEAVFYIREKILNDCILFELSGELKNEIAYEFEDELEAVLTVQHRVRIDLSRVTFIASAGLHTLLHAQQFVDKTADGSMVICGLSSNAAETFENNGFMELFRFDMPGEVTTA